MPTRLLGMDPLTDIISGLKYTHGEFIIPIVFFGIFIFGTVASYKKGRFRKTYTVAVIILFVLASQLALSVYPFTHAHRYSGIADSSEEFTEIRLVDNNGKEIHSDERATLPFRDVAIAEHLLYKWDDDQRLLYTEQFIKDHQRYHEDLAATPFWWRHPPPSVAQYWDDTSLNEHGQLIGVKIYSKTVVYEENSNNIKEMSEYTCEIFIDVERNHITRVC